MMMRRHEAAECPECGAPLVYGTKEEATGWKVYYDCSGDCGFERMVGWVKRREISHRDEVAERAEKMGERWS